MLVKNTGTDSLFLMKNSIFIFVILLEQVQEKFKTLRGLGFKEDEFAYMIFRFPLLIFVSCGKLKRTVEFMVFYFDRTIRK